MKTACVVSTLAAALTLTGTAQAAESQEIKGTIEAVTVYRGQALVTRGVTIPGAAGLHEVVVTDLPEQLLPGSIYAESADGVEVRSVSYRVRPVEKDVREEVRNLDQAIQGLQDKLAANQKGIHVLAEQRTYMDKLEQFIAPTATVEMTKGVLNADTVQKLTGYQFDQRDKMSKEELRLGIEARTLQEQLNTMERQRAQVAGASSRLAREAVVFVNLTKPGGAMRVRYLVANASWAPSYNIRTDKDRKAFAVEYLASIQQLSGEDWPNVAMTLSTATPNLVAMAPKLTELSIALVRTSGGKGGDAVTERYNTGDYQTTKNELLQNKKQVEQQRLILDGTNNYSGNTTINNGTLQLNGSPLLGNNPGQSGLTQQAGNPNGQQDQGFFQTNDVADNNLNEAASSLQMLDILNREKVSRKPTGKATPLSVDEGLSVTYTLTSRTSLPSRSDRQLIQIAAPQGLKPTYYKVACPVLTSYVYDQATVTNDGGSVLLGGPVSTYVDGQFVGQGVLPSVSEGETFTVGLGIDSSLRATRELVEKTETMQGGNRVVDFTYRLAIENFGAKPASVQLLDRIPTAKENEMRVTLAAPGKDGKELSKDAGYEQTERKKGMLRWDVEVPAKAMSTKSLGIEYSFKLEYDKMMSISVPAGTPGAPAARH